jgi:hypothetical protein
MTTEPDKCTSGASVSGTKNTEEQTVEFDQRVDDIDDFDDRFVINCPGRPDRPGRKLRDEPPKYLSIAYEDLDEFVDAPDTEFEDCPQCQDAESDQQRSSDDRLKLLTPRHKLGYNLRCRTCGALLTQIGYAPVGGIVVPEADIEIPTSRHG